MKCKMQDPKFLKFSSPERRLKYSPSQKSSFSSSTIFFIFCSKFSRLRNNCPNRICVTWYSFFGYFRQNTLWSESLRATHTQHSHLCVLLPCFLKVIDLIKRLGNGKVKSHKKKSWIILAM